MLSLDKGKAFEIFQQGRKLFDADISAGRHLYAISANLLLYIRSGEHNHYFFSFFVDHRPKVVHNFQLLESLVFC